MAVDRLRHALSERYSIERELGRGGMATVHLATDVKVGRQVAIKVLHPELAAALGGERFHREIQIATHLTHPNILPVHDSGEADGTLYYVMPFVEGESLRSRLDRERQLPIDEAVRITCQIAGALEYAHRANIVHRDIKPENILLEAGQAVLADFGIARAVTSAADAETLTRTGMSLGTPAYMSPEQAMGERNVDGRSDQYALACVTYEMLAGQPPFTAPSMQALIARHVADPVPLITTVRPSVPEEVEEVILQALEKVPADRFPSIGQFAEALADAAAMSMTVTTRRTAAGRAMRTTARARVAQGKARWSRRKQIAVAAATLVLVAVSGLVGVRAWKGPRTLVSDGSIVDPMRARKLAVLYFDDLSSDSSLGHAADGLTEGLIQELSRVRALDVVSSGGVAPFRDADLSRDSIARALEVGSLIEGSVEPTGNRVRVTARLVDGRSGADLERINFELPPGLLLAARDSLVDEVARWLRVHIGDEVRLQERRASTSNPEAWTLAQLAERLRKDAEASLKGDDQASGVQLLERADSILERAEDADRQWLQPILGRGWIALRRSQLERGHDAVPWTDVGLRHAERALRHSANHPEALALRGTLLYRRWELRVNPDPAALDSLFERARRDLEAAVTADPSLARANITLSYLYYQIRDVPGALLAARRAYEEDAYLEQADRTLHRLFWGSLDLEQFIEARRWCAEGARRFQQDFRFVQCQLWLGVTPAVPPEPQRAWALLVRLDSLTPTPQRGFALAEGRILVAGALARAGLVDSARSVLRRAREGVTGEMDPHQELLAREAYVRTLTGDPDEAIDLLKRYVAANPGHAFAERAGTVWWWRELRGHPRWREVPQPGR